VRHPQPAQAVAPHPLPVGIRIDRHLSRGERQPAPTRRLAPVLAPSGPRVRP
jgi:hypothetical protein